MRDVTNAVQVGQPACLLVRMFCRPAAGKRDTSGAGSSG